jgi:outer membrane usher protein
MFSKITALACAINMLLFSSDVLGVDETFDTHFLRGGMKGEKQSQFAVSADRPLAGVYDLDIYINQQWRGKYAVEVKETAEETCLPLNTVVMLGIKTEASGEASSSQCIPLQQVVQGGQTLWEMSLLRLNLTVPQAFVIEREQGYLPPESWDRGINALYTSYYLSQYVSHHQQGGDSKSSYARFNSGLNLLGWQLHSDASYNKSDDSKGEWKSNTLYLERGIAELMSTLRAGDMYTSGDIFDTVRFRGVRLATDMQMLPDSRQNFTPIVQGIAQSNALVTIEQNGFIIYQKEVPPGPFAISDLSSAGGGADLDVSVKEADGSVTHYLVPFSSVPNMLQPGVSKYDIAAGQSYIEGATEQTDFLQTSYQYGLNNFLTLFGGTLLADDYTAATLGTGWNTLIGALSVDATKSHSKQDDGQTLDGQSYQLSYSKFVAPTQTRFGLAAYRYSSRNYRTFNDHVWANSKDRYKYDENDVYNVGNYYQNDFGRKNSFSVNVSQSLPDGWGSLTASVLWRDYWGKSGNRKDYQVSYANNWRQTSFSLSANQTYDEDDRQDKRVSIYFSVPLNWDKGDSASPRRLTVSNSTTFDNNGYASNTAGLYGMAGSRDQFSYGVNVSNQRQNNETSIGSNLSWNSAFATLNGSVSHSSQYQQASGSIAGGIVVWSGGVNLANRLSDTVAILQAPGLAGAYVNGQRYRTTDRSGTVVYDGLTPYRENQLTLDISQTDSNTALLGNRNQVAPYRGAVVLSRFETDSRSPWYVKARHADASPLTFGYNVFDMTGSPIGVVGQGSQVYMRADVIPVQIRVGADRDGVSSCLITLNAAIDENKTYICQ